MDGNVKKKPEDSKSNKLIFIEPPKTINICKLGIVSHDYRYKEQNGYRDLSHTFKNILSCLDDRGCDSILFSLFTIVKRKSFDAIQILNGLKNIKAVFVEEFTDGYERNAGEYVVYFKGSNKWKEYRVTQKFGTLEYTKAFENAVIEPFKKEVKEQRLFGNCTVLLCGETNIVKYSKATKKIDDKFGLLNLLPKQIEVILNPIHDRMTRFEMKLKRIFLSKNNRWVVSVWNRGKSDKNGKVKDGINPAWTVFYNGEERHIIPIKCHLPTRTNIEIGILELQNA